MASSTLRVAVGAVRYTARRDIEKAALRLLLAQACWHRSLLRGKRLLADDVVKRHTSPGVIADSSGGGISADLSCTAAD